MDERTRTLGLVACLILLATVLAGLSAGVAPSPAVASHPKAPPTGTILVKVFMDQGTNTSSVGIPIPDANITISTASSLPLLPVVFQTNSSGEFEIPIGAGSYAVLIWNSEFRKGTEVVVQENRITEVNVTVTRHSYATLFSDLPDADSSGSVAPWSYVSVAVNSSDLIPLNGSLFMGGLYGTWTTIVVSGESGTQSLASGPFQVILATGNQSEVPVRLISSGLDPTAGSQVLWLTLQPESFFPISGLVSVSLAAYSTELQVTLNAT